MADSSNWRSAFLPGIFQGTYLNTQKTQVSELIANIQNPAGFNKEVGDFLKRLI